MDKKRTSKFGARNMFLACQAQILHYFLGHYPQAVNLGCLNLARDGMAYLLI